MHDELDSQSKILVCWAGRVQNTFRPIRSANRDFLCTRSGSSVVVSLTHRTKEKGTDPPASTRKVNARGRQSGGGIEILRRGSPLVVPSLAASVKGGKGGLQ